MTNTPIQVTTDLSQILSQINQKLDNIQKDISDLKQKDIADLKIGQAKNETELKRIEEAIKIGQTKNETELKRVEEAIKIGQSKSETELKRVEEATKIGQSKIETELKRVEEIVSGKIDGMSKCLDDTNVQIVQLQTRINGQTNWFIGIFSILVTGLLGIFGKIAFFPNP